MYKVSVGMVVKNETTRLKEAVEDILNQSYQGIQLIIVDDASSNIETIELIQQFQKKHKQIRTEYLPVSKGLAHARNICYQLCNTEYFAIADADDRYHPKRIEQQVKFLEKNKDIVICGTNFYYTDKKINWPIYFADKEIQTKHLLNHALIHSSVMYNRKRLIGKIEYNSSFNFVEDYELHYKLFSENKVANLNQHLVYYNRLDAAGNIKPQRADSKIKSRKIRENILLQKNIILETREIELWHKFSELEINSKDEFDLLMRLLIKTNNIRPFPSAIPIYDQILQLRMKNNIINVLTAMFKLKMKHSIAFCIFRLKCKFW